MPKAKVTKEALKQVTRNLGTGGKIGGGAVLAEKATDFLDNPVLNAAEGAVIGGYAGSLAGPFGAAAGAVVGGTIGWMLADNGTIFPVDMICIPAYQAYMVQGEPAFTIYARAGEMIIPTGGNVQDVQQVVEPQAYAPTKKPMKQSGWHKYMKQKKNQIKYKSGSMKGRLNLKAMAKAYKKKGRRK